MIRVSDKTSQAHQKVDERPPRRINLGWVSGPEQVGPQIGYAFIAA